MTVEVILVRHASAGSRKRWDGADRERPLDERGRGQAGWLVGALDGRALGRIASSPYVRCVQTVEQLAAARGVAVEERHELAEGASPAQVIALVRELAAPAALCTHGDVMLELVDDEDRCAKGAAWICRFDGGRLVPERYLEPPDE